MNTEKEIGAFVDRMAKRLNDAKGSRRARHRAAFIAVRPLIEAALCRGHTLKATWEALREEGKLAMTYETFRGYCRAMGLGTGGTAISAERLQARQPEPADKTPTVPNARLSPTRESVPSASSSTASGTRTFRHERIPRTEKIYG